MKKAIANSVKLVVFISLQQSSPFSVENFDDFSIKLRMGRQCKFCAPRKHVFRPPLAGVSLNFEMERKLFTQFFGNSEMHRKSFRVEIKQWRVSSQLPTVTRNYTNVLPIICRTFSIGKSISYFIKSETEFIMKNLWW